MLRIGAIILVGLFCQADAAMQCLITPDTGEAAVGNCVGTSCWTHVAASAVTYGCEVSATACDKSTGECTFCSTNRETGCNAAGSNPDFTCFSSVSTKAAICTDGKKTDECFTMTKTDGDKEVTRGCGACAAVDPTSTCTTCIAKEELGCNAPSVFQCFNATSTEAVDCATKPYTETQCYTKKNSTGDEVVLTKGCGKCTTTIVAGITCEDCVGAGCNSATSLFSLLAVGLAVFYQMA